MPGRLEFDVHFTLPQTQEKFRPSQDSPMHILIMGDFTGRGNRGTENAAAIAERPPVSVDVDNFDDCLFRFGPRLQLPVGDGGESIPVEFKQLDDFHPDGLYENLDLFKALRQLRADLTRPDTFRETAARLKQDSSAAHETKKDQSTGKEVFPESESSMFERLLGQAPPDSPQARTATSPMGFNLDRFIEQIVSPHIVPDTDEQAQYISSVDITISETMRRLLHDPSFQALEAAWRGVSWLISQLEMDENLKLFLVDVTKEEIISDLNQSQGQLENSALYRLLVDKGGGMAGGIPWATVVGNFQFGFQHDDINALSRLGALARHANCPFIAAGHCSLLGCDSLLSDLEPKQWQFDSPELVKQWRELRSGELAPWLGLALPRFLLRLPYGENTEEIDRFAFEEMPPQRPHDSYLWGNPGFVLALLLGRSFLHKGWHMQPGDHLHVEDLPAHTYVDDGETKLQACAEVFINERVADAVLAAGIMPLLSYKNRNAVTVPRFQSIAQPARGLAGPWA